MAALSSCCSAIAAGYAAFKIAADGSPIAAGAGSPPNVSFRRVECAPDLPDFVSAKIFSCAQPGLQALHIHLGDELRDQIRIERVGATFGAVA